jgi:hypothetical protein
MYPCMWYQVVVQVNDSLPSMIFVCNCLVCVNPPTSENYVLTQFAVKYDKLIA